MPHLKTSAYHAPWWLPGGHLQTVVPALLRRESAPVPQEETITLEDGDLLEIDRYRCGKERSRRGVAVMSHGMEGNARRPYMLGLCRHLLQAGFDVIARNFRGCGITMNPGPKLYHGGETQDLDAVVRHALEEGYETVVLTGVSMGGNQVLKYLGENPDYVPRQVRTAAVFSVPCDLAACARALDLPANLLYRDNFLRTLRRKVREKHLRHPRLYPVDGLERVTTIQRFDNRYTAPIHGFSSAEDYWERSSCLPWLEGIRIPALLVSALNDPFLEPSCYPVAAAEANRHLFLETPKSGGHMGFSPALPGREYWSDLRVVRFFEEVCP